MGTPQGHPLVLLQHPDAHPRRKQKLPLIFAASASNVPINMSAIAPEIPTIALRMYTSMG